MFKKPQMFYQTVGGVLHSAQPAAQQTMDIERQQVEADVDKKLWEINNPGIPYTPQHIYSAKQTVTETPNIPETAPQSAEKNSLKSFLQQLLHRR